MRHGRILAPTASLAFLGLLATTNCARDDEGECSIDGNKGCDDGLVCRKSVEGPPMCFCSTDEQSGCGEGLACYDVENGDPACFCSVDEQSGCDDDALACELIPGEGAGCFTPVTMSGSVFDLASSAAIEGARVVARDANNAAVSGVAITDASGNYTLQVPNPRTADGALLPSTVTLRADAAGFLSFPKAPRVALPIETSTAAGDPPNVDTPATHIGMVALPDTTGLGTIRGTVHADRPRGTVVVAGGAAGGAGGGVTGVADFDGTYAVFNVPAGSVGVSGYKVGQQLDSVTADVTAGGVTEGVDLTQTGDAVAIVSGKIEVVNPGAGNETTVVLVVDETFDDAFKSGETPPGLRVADVTGEFSIQGVPDGNYVALAAFENDFLVRDPDTAIGGTAIVRFTVAGGNVAISEGFKVTGALDVVSPDAEQVVAGTPTFIWRDDSGEDHYEIVVYDVFGNLIWEKLDVPGVSGDAEVRVPYEGPALMPGLLYQFRGTSIKQGGTPLARTEDLRGVFVAG